MRSMIIILLAMFLNMNSHAQPKIIPEPVSMVVQNGTLPLGNNVIWATDIKNTASLSLAKTQLEADFKKTVAANGGTRISLSLFKKPDNTIGNEGYLSIKKVSTFLRTGRMDYSMDYRQ